MRWRQTDKAPNANPTREQIIVPQPKACETCCSACQKIDQHNRSRQSTLMSEKKVRVTEFDRRINTSVFAMTGPVDAWFLYEGIRSGSSRGHLVQERHFFELLIEQLIDNKFDSKQATTRSNKQRSDAEMLLQVDDDGIIPSHMELVGVTPTKRYKKNRIYRLQGMCLVCNKPATTVCRECQRAAPFDKHQHWICDKKGKKCMCNHIMAAHPDMIVSDKKPVDWNRVISCSLDT